MFELCRYRVANLTSFSELMLKSDSLTKIHIEFKRGSKLPETSSEALLYLCSLDHLCISHNASESVISIKFVQLVIKLRYLYFGPSIQVHYRICANSLLISIMIPCSLIFQIWYLNFHK